MASKLSEQQQKAYDLLCKKGKWHCAFELQVSLSTLQALVKKGYAESVSVLGASYSPRTAIEFKAIKQEIKNGD